MYSFCIARDLVSQIAMLSSKDRAAICNTELVNQDRILKVKFDKYTKIPFGILDYCLNLCTSV